MSDRPQLTEREIEILKQVATGASNRQIAQALSISANTVKVHLRNVYEKLGVASRTEATLVAIQSGLIESVESDAVVGETRWWQRGSVIAGGALVLVMVTLLVAVIVSPGGPPPENTVDLEALERERWQELAPMPTARKGLAVAAYDGKIYAIAGETEDGVTGVVERYDPATNTWETLPSKPTAVTDVEAAVVGGKIYVLGRKLGTDPGIGYFEAYDPNIGNWKSLTALQAKTRTQALFTYEGKIFSIIKFSDREDQFVVYEYWIDDDKWTQAFGFDLDVDNIDVCTIKDKVYIIGSTTNGNYFIKKISLFEIARIGQDEPVLSELPDLTLDGNKVSVECLANFVFVFGKGTTRYTINTYYPQRREWVSYEIPSLSNSNEFSTTSMFSEIYLVGGVTESSVSSHFLKYLALYTVQLPIIQQPQ